MDLSIFRLTINACRAKKISLRFTVNGQQNKPIKSLRDAIDRPCSARDFSLSISRALSDNDWCTSWWTECYRILRERRISRAWKLTKALLRCCLTSRWVDRSWRRWNRRSCCGWLRAWTEGSELNWNSLSVSRNVVAVVRPWVFSLPSAWKSDWWRLSLPAVRISIYYIPDANCSNNFRC